MIVINCLNCLKDFKAKQSEINRGNAKFCSRICSSAYNSKIRKDKHKIKIPNVECAYCKKLIYKSQKSIKQSKHNIFFCSRNHKDLSLRKESNLNVALPSHYKQGMISDYRTVYLRANDIKCCETCGYDKIKEILEIHHKDRNRNNNNFSNLIALCPTCHMEEHFKTKDGKWKP